MRNIIVVTTCHQRGRYEAQNIVKNARQLRSKLCKVLPCTAFAPFIHKSVYIHDNTLS